MTYSSADDGKMFQRKWMRWVLIAWIISAPITYAFSEMIGMKKGGAALWAKRIVHFIDANYLGPIAMVVFAVAFIVSYFGPVVFIAMCVIHLSAKKIRSDFRKFANDAEGEERSSN